MDDLAQRLRDNADLDAAEGGNPDVCQLEREAADRIDALTARMAELEAALRPALHDALDLLTLGADSLRECSTRDDVGTDWTGEPEAHADYLRIMCTVETLRRAAALLSPKEE